MPAWPTSCSPATCARKPVVIVQGRSDTLVPVNHASRAYAAFNSKVEGTLGNLRYYEIENGNHFDAFLPNAAGGGVQGYDALLVPVHYYFVNGMDLMWASLKTGVALPASQVVRTIPRGGAAGAAPRDHHRQRAEDQGSPVGCGRDRDLWGRHQRAQLTGSRQRYPAASGPRGNRDAGLSSSRREAPQSRHGFGASIQACAGSLWKCQTRCGPAITLR